MGVFSQRQPRRAGLGVVLDALHEQRNRRVHNAEIASGGHPHYPKKDWKYEVTNGDTRLGYEEWVQHKVEADRD